MASSIAYSWFASAVRKTPCVALLQTPRNDLELRPENIHAFELGSLSSSRDELLCIDDIPQSTPFPSNRFALVDHNRLLARFSDQNEDLKVVAVFDHHEDEGLYKDTADPRLIVVPTGSASSIVAQYIGQHTSQIPPEIARLLLCAILVDTAGLRPGGKAEEPDRAAAAFLLPRTELPNTISTFVSHEDSTVFTLARDLLTKKADVSQLSTTALLKRDYKQYAWAEKTRSVHVGLSTVPLDLHVWLARGPLEDFWRDVDSFMKERDLDVLAILNTFHKETHSKKKDKKKTKKRDGGDDEANSERPKGKHKRQMMIFVRDVPGENLQEKLFAGLEGASELALEKRSLAKFTSKHRKDKGEDQKSDLISSLGTTVRVYKQGNAHATRKIIAPLMKSIVEGA